METIEKTILKALLDNELYMRRVIPFIKEEYFTGTEALIFTKIYQFINKYNTAPSIDALEISFQNDKEIPENHFKELGEITSELRNRSVEKSLEWLLNTTEEFCKNKAIYNSILKSIKIIDGTDKTLSQGSIPTLLQEALAVCFDTSVGHNYFEDAEKRHDFYNQPLNKLEFSLAMLNKITDHGIRKKTLTIIMAPTGVGKTLVMCHLASDWIKQGKNVLYISMEMEEYSIAERIDANLLDCNINKVRDIPKAAFSDRVKKIVDKTRGKFIVKEYPTSTAHVNHFRTLLNDLQLKQKFIPDVILIDYLNICASSRFKPGSNVNSYTIIKGIAEELRGLAVEYDVPIVSATQSNRAGYGNSDTELTDTSESMGLPMTVDYMWALISTEELENLNQIMFKQLKNRYGDPSKNKRFVMGIDRPKMKLYDLEDSAQINISDSGQPPADTDKFNQRPSMNKYAHNKFESFKV